MPIMHGPAFDKNGNASGKIVEREVSDADITAFKRAGYEEGPILESKESPAIEEEAATAEEEPKKGKK